MKIAVNTRLLLEGRLEGLGWFTYQTMKRIVNDHPEHEFFFLFDRPYSKKFIFGDNVTPVVVHPPTRHPLLWYFWFEWALPRVFKRIQPDVFVSTDGYLSLRSKVRTVDVIHDINFEHYPNNIRWSMRRYLQYYFPRFAQRADRIVTVSEYSKSDIAETYGINPNKIDVAYNGASNTFRPLSVIEKEQVRIEYSEGQPYFIYVGALLPRKNIARLLRAFDIFKTSTQSQVKMLIVGAKMFKTSDIYSTLKNLKYKNDVIFTGHLPQGKLEFTAGAALALTYVSYFEGFGIPLVEAMRADVPIITSNATSLPEVAGSAALLCDPFSEQSIANAMVSMYSDDNLRIKLIAEGRKRCQLFNWDSTADALWKSIIMCVE